MAAFAVLSDAGALEEVSETLAERPERLIGLWIDGGGHHGRPSRDAESMVTRLAAVPALGVEPVHARRRWSLCRIATVDQIALLDLLMYLSGGRRGAAAGRFVPVFRADMPVSHRRAAWFELAERYPGAVLPPLVQDAGGSLSCDVTSLLRFPAA